MKPGITTKMIRIMFWKLLFFVIIVLFAVYSIRSVSKHFLYLNDVLTSTPEQCSKEFRGLLATKDLAEMNITNIAMNALMAANQALLCYILLHGIAAWLTWKVAVGNLVVGAVVGAITFHINKTIESVVAPYVTKAERATDFSQGERLYFSSARENNSRLIILGVTIAAMTVVAMV